ncbi:MAG: DNA polymerase III subunit gamma/tau [Parachlamydiaceae bacterium]
MAHYQVLARKYRPQLFRDVLGQEAIVTTLKNAIKMGRLAHAYLFCGSRGTGKTTLARVFAKALNCQAPTADGEPCNLCASCKEIGSGSSLDVLEIDGASHRGIDDIRQINETVGYASSSGKYKIYIIDEVHMLTKEAFNALLKTLEEPPAKVLFIFATTEPHKVLPTILSRCQRFNLGRISIDQIIAKLRHIATDLKIDVEDEAVRLLAQRAEGGLRDAESLFDQIIAFHEGRITTQTVNDVLGIMSKDVLFSMDRAGKEGRLAVAFEIVHQVLAEGKDISQFIETMVEHFRTLLLIKMAGVSAPFLSLFEADKPRYQASAELYTQEQCLTILDFLVESQSQMRFHSSGRIALETILLHVMRVHQRLPIGFLVRRLAELEQAVQGGVAQVPLVQEQAVQEQAVQVQIVQEQAVQEQAVQVQIVQEQAVQQQNSTAEVQPLPVQEKLPIVPKPLTPVVQSPVLSKGSITEDPTPTPAELGVKNKPKVQVVEEKLPPAVHKQSHYDTLLQFAAVELEGTVQKK